MPRRFRLLNVALTLAGTTLASISCSSAEFMACSPENSCAAGSSEHGGESTAGGGSNEGGIAGISGGSGMLDAAGRGGAGHAGDANSAGAAGTSACDGDCKGATPVCDAASNTCVGCLKASDCKPSTPVCDTTLNTCVECAKSADCKSAGKPACDTTSSTCVSCVGNADCKDATKPFCDKAAAQCVACLKQADCTDAKASVCSAGACTACTVDADCSSIAGKGVCDAGTCVQCTGKKESVCGGTSCNPTTKSCTTTTLGSLTTCEACVADTECTGGNEADADARCVPMSFMGVPRQGGFCLRRVSKTCGSPYKIVISAASLSGAALEDYCGIAQDLTRCEAVLDLVNSKACPDMMDSSCGCQRNAAGACIGAGQGGLCRKVGPDQNHCTYECGSATQCSGGYNCVGSPTLYCQ